MKGGSTNALRSMNILLNRYAILLVENSKFSSFCFKNEIMFLFRVFQFDELIEIMNNKTTRPPKRQKVSSVSS